MRIYTKTGDSGKTGLYRGPRVSKDDARIEAYGTVDELSSVIGLVRSEEIPDELDSVLRAIQQQLFSVGAELATPEFDSRDASWVGPEEVNWIEQVIDRFDGQLPALSTFILPAGNRAAAQVHHARVVCRRAERRVVSLARTTDLNGESLSYLNRLSDLLFVLARYTNFSAGEPDVAWERPRTDSPEPG